MKKYNWDKLEAREINSYTYHEEKEDNSENLIDELFDSIDL